MPVLWPEGTGWNPSAQEVRLSNGDLAAMGDSVTGGGGSYGTGHEQRAVLSHRETLLG